MAITILVFMASIGTWWIVPCVGFHLHIRAPCKCISLSSMRTESAWMNLNEGVSLLQWLTSDICVNYTATVLTPHGLLSHSAGKWLPPVLVLSLLLHHKCFATFEYVKWQVCWCQAFKCQNLFNFVGCLFGVSFPRGDLTEVWQPYVQLDYKYGSVISLYSFGFFFEAAKNSMLASR